MSLGRQCLWLLRQSHQPYLSAVTSSRVGQYVARSERGFSSNKKLVDVTVDEKTGKKLLELTRTC